MFKKLVAGVISASWNQGNWTVVIFNHATESLHSVYLFIYYELDKLWNVLIEKYCRIIWLIRFFFPSFLEETFTIKHLETDICKFELVKLDSNMSGQVTIIPFNEASLE